MPPESDINLNAASIRVMAELPAIQTRSTGFHIAPFLARIVPPAEWHFAQPEIAEVLCVPLRYLANPDNAAQEQWQLPGWPQPELVSFWRIGAYSLWGASYRILQPLLPRLLAGEWSI